MPFDTGILAIALAVLSFCGALGCLVALLGTRRTLAQQQEAANAQFAQLQEKLAALTAPANAAEPSTEPAELQDDLLAAITAAAAAVADRKSRIRSIQQVQPESESANAWSQQGRVVVQSSHNIGPHR